MHDTFFFFSSLCRAVFFLICLFLSIRPRFTAEKSRFSVSVTCLHLTSAERAVVSIEQQKSCAFFFLSLSLFLIPLSLFIFFFFAFYLFTLRGSFFIIIIILGFVIITSFFFYCCCCCCFCECYQGKFLGTNPPFEPHFFPFPFPLFSFFFSFMMTK